MGQQGDVEKRTYLGARLRAHTAGGGKGHAECAAAGECAQLRTRNQAQDVFGGVLWRHIHKRELATAQLVCDLGGLARGD